MDDKTVDNYLNIMGFVTVKLHAEDKLTNLAVDAHLDVSLLPDLVEQITIMAFSASDNRS